MARKPNTDGDGDRHGLDTLHDILKDLDALDTRPADKLVLLAVYELGSANRNKLADHTGLAYSTVHRAINRLEDAEQITTKADFNSRMKSKRVELLDDDQSREYTPVWERKTA